MVFIVLSRLITPEDFGVMTAAMMVVAFSQIFWENGTGKALIQRQTDIMEAANAAFFINIGLGVLITAFLVLLAQPIALIVFKDHRVTRVLQVMALQVLIGALCSVHTSLLQKNMAFRTLFWVRFSTVTLPSLTSIPLAFYGLGYWALVVGTIFGKIIQAVLLWKLNKWRPTFVTNMLTCIEISKFSGWVCVTGLLTWFYAWADSLIVGIYLSGHDLGIYRVGTQFANLIIGLVFMPLIPVLFSYLSTISGEPNKIIKFATKTTGIISIMVIPLGIFLFFESNDIAKLVFGTKWNGVEIVIGFIALAYSMSYLSTVSPEVCRAMGRPQLEFYLKIIFLPVYLLVYMLSIKNGLQTFLVARLPLTILTVIANFVILSFVIKYKPYVILKYMIAATLISSSVFASTLYVLKKLDLTIHLHLGLTILINASLLIPIFYYYGKKDGLLLSKKDIL